MSAVYSPSTFIQNFIGLLIVFIVTTIFTIFSPLGIFFIVFSIIRAKTQNLGLRIVSFALQVILSILTLLSGILVGILFSVRNLGFYYFSSPGWVFSLAVILGVSFVFLIEIGIIVWQGFLLKKKGNA